MIRTVFENKFFLVISKPSGVSAHNETPSVSEWLKENNLSQHLVNRLDRETSGLMIIAKKPELHTELSQSMEAGQKIYRALLYGKWKGPRIENSTITWTFALTDRAEGRDHIQGDKSDQKPCITEAKLIRTNDYFSEVELLLLSGRQHQIRRHAAISGQALVGDDRYGNAKFNLKIHNLYPNISHRLQLHAEHLRISFRGESFKFSDPNYSVHDFFNAVDTK